MPVCFLINNFWNYMNIMALNVIVRFYLLRGMFSKIP
jgi:hypothetical protein